MKYYSEILNKYFNNEKECLEAEKLHKSEQLKLENKLKQSLEDKKIKDQERSNLKKRFAKAIEDAERELEEANKLYDIAKDEAKAILEKSNKEAKEVLDLAATKVKEATKKKTQAIVAFNKEFGPYVTSITGVKAADEFNRTINAINELFNKFILF